MIIKTSYRIESQERADKPWVKEMLAFDWVGSESEIYDVLAARRITQPEKYWRVVKITEEQIA